MVFGDSGNRQYQRQYSVSGDGDLAHGGTARDEPRLSSLRYSTCGAAHDLASARILCRTGQNAAGLKYQTSGLEGAEIHGPYCRGTFASGSDQFCEDVVEVQQRIQSGSTDGRPRPAGPLPDAPAAGAGLRG